MNNFHLSFWGSKRRGFIFVRDFPRIQSLGHTLPLVAGRTSGSEEAGLPGRAAHAEAPHNIAPVSGSGEHCILHPGIFADHVVVLEGQHLFIFEEARHVISEGLWSGRASATDQRKALIANHTEGVRSGSDHDAPGRWCPGTQAQTPAPGGGVMIDRDLS